MLFGIPSVFWEGTISTVEDIQYYRGVSSVPWSDIISTVEDIQYGGEHHQCCGGYSVLWQDTISTFKDTIITLVEVQFCGRHSVRWGISPVLWRMFSTVKGYHQCCGQYH